MPLADSRGPAVCAELIFFKTMKNRKISDFLEPPILIEPGENREVLIIVFSGFQGRVMLHPYEFFTVSGLLQYSRILLRDTSRTCYLAGIPPHAEGYQGLLEFLREAITELTPEKIITVGTSGGATAALWFGHDLAVDYVHAFAPYTSIDDEELFGERSETRDKILALPGIPEGYLDVSHALSTDNGRTRYFVHTCKFSAPDMDRAMRLAGCPGVQVISAPCDEHRVTHYLVKKNLIRPMLNINNQENLLELIEKGELSKKSR